MTKQERESVLVQLASSEARLQELVGGLSAAQWSFREAEGRWSIAEVIEHCILFEEFIREVIAKTLEGPAQAEKMAGAVAKEPLVRQLAESRGTRFAAREIVRPVGTWATDDLVDEFRKTRARTVAFVEHLQGDLRAHFFPHVAFGDLDCYQWLVVLGQHGARHALQIDEIKRNAGYPASQ
jgi:hypothetical protein